MGSLSPARHTIITNPEGERPGPVKPPPDPAKPSLMQVRTSLLLIGPVCNRIVT